MKIRIRETEAVILENEFRAMYPNTSFPQVLTGELLDTFGADPVLEGPQPDLTETQYSVYTGVQQIKDQWFTKYEAKDYTPEELAAQLEQRRQTMVLSPFQAKAVLLQENLLDDVETIINDPKTDRLIVLAWNNVTEFKRLSPMVLELAKLLNLTDKQLDDLFIAGAQIIV